MPSINCENCGHELTDKVAVCPACGAALNPAKPITRFSSLLGMPMSLAIIIPFILVAFLAGILVVKFFPTSQPDAVQSKPANDPIPDFQETKTKAERGDAQSQDILGKMYSRGKGVPQDYAAAAKWYRQAADQGSADGENSLGELYEAGQGVKRDEAEAAQWYRKAADQGHVGGQYNLGVMYEYGRGVEKNSAEAAKWFRQAAEQGDALAQFNLGQRYDRGLGVTVDLVEAYQWYSLAAAQRIADAATFRDELKDKMTGDQVKEGKRRVSAFVPKKSARGAAR